MRILIADDDPQITRALRIMLTSRGYHVHTALDGHKAIDLAVDHPIDLYVIDLGMPNLDGISLIEAIRGWSDAPILVISGRTNASDKVRALDAGADDYMTKPFAIDELLARIRALERRMPRPSTEPIISFADITINLAARTVTRTIGDRGVGIRLTPTEWKVLEVLVRNPHTLVTRESLLREIWGAEHFGDSGYLRLYVSQLRKKLEPDPQNPVHLVTEAGMGYRFEPGGTDGADVASTP